MADLPAERLPSASAVGGSNTQLQYNANGSLAGIAEVTWSGSALAISSGDLGIGIAVPTEKLHIKDAGLKVLMETVGDTNFVFTINTDSVKKAVWGYRADDNALKFNHEELGTTITPNQLVVKEGSVGIGTATFHADCVSCLTIANGTEPGAHTDNQIYFHSKDSTAGGATLGLFTESEVAVIGTFTPSHKAYIWLNGVEYAIQLDAV